MSKQLLKTLAVMAVLLSLAAVPAMAQAQNGPLISTCCVSDFGGLIATIDPTTGEQGFIPGAIPSGSASVTPDGNTVIYPGDVGGNRELFSVPIDGSAAPTQLTSTARDPGTSFKMSPVVSPNGETVYFTWARYDSDGTSHSGVYSVPIGGGEPTQIVEDNVGRAGMEITPDGKYLLYLTPDAEGSYKKVVAMSVNGGPSRTVVDITRSAVVTEFFPALTISPDGKTVAIPGIDRNANSLSIYTAPLSLTRKSQPTILPGTTLTPFVSFDGTGASNSYISLSYSPDGTSIAYIWSGVRPAEIGGFVVDEIGIVPATGGTPTVIVPPRSDSNFLHEDLLWAPQAVTSVVPEVVEPTDPVNGATEVGKTIQPKATFNTDLDASTVNAQNVRLEVYNSTQQKWVLVSSTPSYDQDTKTITVTPAKSLSSQKEYRVTLSTGIKSATGGKLASPYSWTFTTRK